MLACFPHSGLLLGLACFAAPPTLCIPVVNRPTGFIGFIAFTVCGSLSRDPGFGVPFILIPY
jgi:hypothetical protein